MSDEFRNISYPTLLNQYEYCFGNPLGLIDHNEKTSRKAILANPSNAELISRKNAEKDVLQNDNGAPYVGVFYLNSTLGAGGKGHVAMLLLRNYC